MIYSYRSLDPLGPGKINVVSNAGIGQGFSAYLRISASLKRVKLF